MNTEILRRRIRAIAEDLLILNTHLRTYDEEASHDKEKDATQTEIQSSERESPRDQLADDTIRVAGSESGPAELLSEKILTALSDSQLIGDTTELRALLLHATRSYELERKKNQRLRAAIKPYADTSCTCDMCVEIRAAY